MADCSICAGIDPDCANCELLNPTQQENTMTNPTPAAALPVNEKALRRWINDQYEGAASCSTWTLAECLEFAEEYHVQGLDAFRQTPYRAFDIYLDRSPEVRAAVDAIFNAVRAVASPLLGMDYTAESGVVGCSFTWHDGAQYRVEVKADGALARLYRYELTGAWVQEDEDLVPDATWRTVRAFSRDRAGKVLAPALQDLPSTIAWTRAAGL